MSKISKKIAKYRRGAKGASAFIRLTRNLSELDEVFKLSEQIIDEDFLKELEAKFSADPAAVQAMKERRRFKLDLKALKQLPENTLGRILAEEMIKKGLDPASLPVYPSNNEHEFIVAHLYDSHDIWHAVTGFDTDIPGELGLQGFYLAQFAGRLNAALLSIGLLNTALFNHGESDLRMDQIVKGWLMGKSSKQLFGVYWPDFFALPIEEVRERLGIRVEQSVAA